MTRKVVIITTGGTIAMRHDAAKGGSVPAVSGKDLIEAVPPLKAVSPIEVREFSNIPSFHMTPALMQSLALTVEEALADPETAGAVITHGTDTLEETAYFLDLYTASPKPVCLTAAMRNSDDINPDGPYNILSAVRVAASPQTREHGVMVVMNGEVHAAREVTKTHSAGVHTFASPFWGPLGYVDDDAVRMPRTPSGRLHLRPTFVAERVPVLKLYTGMDDTLFDALLDADLEGLVLEGFGRGNVPNTAVPGIERLLKKDIPVVLTSRVPGGRVLGVYAATGGAGHLKTLGVIFGGELSSWKARLKLMLALGLTRNPVQLQTFFE